MNSGFGQMSDSEVLSRVESLPRPDVRTSVRKVPTKASTESTAPLLEQNQSPRCDTRPTRRAQTKPLGEQRYKVTFTANKALVAKLQRLAALMSHQTAPGDLPAVLDKALDIAIEAVEKRRFGRKAQKKAPPRAQTARTRYIPSATRREVHDRDGGQCTFVGTGGRRCRSEQYLQLDHIVPYAKGGTNTPDNLRIRCASHNLHTAIQEYGQDFMAEFMLTSPG